MPPPLVSFILLNWNTRDLLRDCLASIQVDAGYEREIIVVDSASRDGSAEMVRAEFPDARLIASADNLGYSRGNNLGLRAATGQFIFVLNPDTQLRAGAVAALLETMTARPDIGLLGPRLLSPDGTTQSSRRRWPTTRTAFMESTWLQPYAPPGLLDHFYAADLPDDTLSEVDWVTGAALFLRREVYAQVGGLDEGFFMYSEELDWQRRVHAAGWKIAWEPRAEVFHFEGKSSEQVPAETHIRFNRSKIRYFRKYHGAVAAQALRAFLLLGFAQQIVVESLKLALRHKPELRRRRIEAYWKVIRSGL